MKFGSRNMMLTCILLLVNYMQIGANELSSESVNMLNSSLVVELIEGATIEIHCESSRNMSASEISWKFNGVPLQQTADVTGCLSILTIDILSFNQSGLYSCGFIDQGNELWENVSITVGRKPQPVRNLTCVEKPGYDFTCSWLPSKIATNLPTTYFYKKVQFSDGPHGHDNWKKVENLYIDFKNHRQKQHFSVKTSNELGDSEVVKTTFSIAITAPDVLATFDDDILYVNWTRLPNHLKNIYRLRYREIFPTHANWTTKEYVFDLIFTLNVSPGYREYEVQVAVAHYHADNYDTWSETVVAMKQETRPNGTVPGSCTWNQDNDMECSWDALPKDKHNGRLLGYNVFVFRKGEKYMQVTKATTSNKKLHAVFEGLPTEYNYTVNITAYNSAGSATILTTSVDHQPASSAVAVGYIVLIVCVSIPMLFLITLLLVRCIKKADFMKPLPEPKYFYSSEWGTVGCAEKHHSEVETFNELKSRNTASEKGDHSEQTFMLPEKGCEVNEDCCLGDDQQSKPVREVTNLTYLILGRKQEQQNNNISHPDINEEDLQEMNSSEENSDDTNVCYLRLRNGNLLTQVQHHENASEVIPDDPSLSINPLPINPLQVAVNPVSNLEEAFESLLTDRSALSSEGYVSGSGTSCLTAYTQLSSS